MVSNAIDEFIAELMNLDPSFKVEELFKTFVRRNGFEKQAYGWQRPHHRNPLVEYRYLEDQIMMYYDHLEDHKERFTFFSSKSRVQMIYFTDNPDMLKKFYFPQEAHPFLFELSRLARERSAPAQLGSVIMMHIPFRQSYEVLDLLLLQTDHAA